MRDIDDSTLFWKRGKIILQNVQDNFQCRKCKIPTDELKSRTISRVNQEDECDFKQHKSDSECSDYEDALSVDGYDENEFDYGVEPTYKLNKGQKLI